jgi:hypothetical protein
MIAERNQLLGQLHRIAKNMGLDEDDYRDRLHLVAGVRSAKTLTEQQLRDAVTKFPVKHSASNVSQPEQRKAKALWISCWNLGALDAGGDAALDAFVKRQTGKERLLFLTPPEANKVTEALKDIAKRKGFAVPSNDKGGIEARRALVKAQWKILADRGDVSDDDWARESYLGGAILNRTDTTANFKRQDWDAAIRLLGAKIRKGAKRKAQPE